MFRFNVCYKHAWEIAPHWNASLGRARCGGGVGGDVGAAAVPPLPIKGLKGLVNAC